MVGQRLEGLRCEIGWENWAVQWEAKSGSTC